MKKLFPLLLLCLITSCTTQTEAPLYGEDFQKLQKECQISLIYPSLSAEEQQEVRDKAFACEEPLSPAEMQQAISAYRQLSEKSLTTSGDYFGQASFKFIKIGKRSESWIKPSPLYAFIEVTNHAIPNPHKLSGYINCYHDDQLLGTWPYQMVEFHAKIGASEICYIQLEDDFPGIEKTNRVLLDISGIVRAP